jgi:hypothetical protein
LFIVAAATWIEGATMPGIPGFDRSDYPGDDVMTWLRAHTNLQWCGYYFAPAPSHGDTSWMARRSALVAAGWGIAPIYVGQQITGPGSHNPSAGQGTTDGASAAAFMASEGFEAGRCVYLDLENGPPLTTQLRDYVATWCDAVLEGGFLPGVYCSHGFAIDVHDLRSDVRIWAFNVSATRSHPVPAPFPDTHPSGCGYLGASAWQLGQSCVIDVPPANLGKLIVDLSTALSADPSQA